MAYRSSGCPELLQTFFRKAREDAGSCRQASRQGLLGPGRPGMFEP